MTTTKTATKRARKTVALPPYVYPLDPKTNVVCGFDEAGRGPLMGDVVAACVVLDHDHMIEGLNDSKKLSEKKRDALAPIIKAQAKAWGIGRASPQEIDQLNIIGATFLAMRRAYDEMCANFKVQVNLALVDGNLVPPTLPCYSEAVVKGDAQVAEIAAASILAKTTRDADLYALDQQYPQYQFGQHKGYPTAAHLALIQELPLLPCYRTSYGPVKKLIAARSAPAQVASHQTSAAPTTSAPTALGQAAPGKVAPGKAASQSVDPTYYTLIEDPDWQR
ncbi:MAG TPA: ribonuclease HII [Candidatus Anaerobiospirillum stercoravium]|nr:ribonuclease HII [Candidatus Anaerobiospirillum stercoravium]